jgi:hypothetical protein
MTIVILVASPRTTTSELHHGAAVYAPQPENQAGAPPASAPWGQPADSSTNSMPIA